MTDRELMQQVLYAMEAIQAYLEVERKGLRIFDEAIEALRARLAQPEPEPESKVRFKPEMWNVRYNRAPYRSDNPSDCHVVLMREWQGLTDEEVGMLAVFDGLHHVEVPLLADFARAIEAKLKEKNSG